MPSYHVDCPQPGCDWSGHLPPRHAADFWCDQATIAFQCPFCLQEWDAHVIDGEAKLVPVEDSAEQEIWAPLEIGVGD
jgi:hypothetical protein